MDSFPNQEKRKRLIVLVPESLAGDLKLAHKVHWIAIRDRCDVLYLTLVDEYEKMLTVSRRMATMKAVTSDDWLFVNTMVVETSGWLKTLREIYQPGDILVCHSEQLVKNGLFGTIPIQEFLQASLKAPVATLSGFFHPQRAQVRQWLQGGLFWIGCLAILGGFITLGIEMDHQAQGFARTALLIVGIMIAIGAIWVWNNLTNR